MHKEEFKKLSYLVAAFSLFFIFDFKQEANRNAVLEGVFLLQEYIREHTLTCLVPALFISGGIGALVSQVSVIRYFTAGVSKWVSYSIASVSGTVLAVCSCTVLPLFSGIYRRGAGLGPAIAFLYSGPAINVLALVLTARILGWELGTARFLFSVLFSIIIGLLMAIIFHRSEKSRVSALQIDVTPSEKPVWKNVSFFVWMVVILLVATLPELPKAGWYKVLFNVRYQTAIGLAVALAASSFYLLTRDERSTWLLETWENTKMIVPWLFVGVFIAGVMLGRHGQSGLIPRSYIESAVGGESIFSVLVASVSGALMYFATLTEIPILQGLISAGMGKGPALALLLSGPALSLPSILALRSIMGLKLTIVYSLLVIIFSTFAGFIYGNYLTH